ncbi:hypothetical protein FK513_32225, partial [Klebsiella pneumoniae]|nr:hypothetical protein [Klebsiella pneumoniae]
LDHRINNLVINRCRKPADADILVPARRSSGGCGRRWPMAWRRRRGCASLSWCLALIRLIRG